MSRPDPKIDSRRADDLFRELLGRVRTWIPAWQPPTQSGKDFGHALLHIAARLGAEVTERLDRTPAKFAFGLLDWLGITRRAGRAARMPVVFKMANGTTDSVLATAPVRIQANVGDTPIAFETQEDVRLVPSPIQKLVGVDPAQDKIYSPPAEVLSLEAPESGPAEWTVKSLAAAGNSKIQLSPALGLKKETILKIDDLEYRIVADPDGDIITVDPLVGTSDSGTSAGNINAGATVSKVSSFIPFDGSSRNQQKHELYIGDDNALNLSAPACIALAGGAGLPDDLSWEYWGKVGEEEPAWHGLTLVGREGANLFLKKEDETDKTGKKQRCSIEIYEIDSKKKSHWIRARRTASDKRSVSFEQIQLKINCSSATVDCPEFGTIDPDQMPKMEGVANNTSLVMNERFYPLGKIPRPLDSFYLGCEEVFSKPSADVCVNFKLTDPTLGPLVIAAKPYGYYPYSQNSEFFVYGIGHDGFLHRYLLSINTPSPPQKPEPLLKYLGFTRPTDQSFTMADHTKPPVVIAQYQNIRVVIWSDKRVWIWDQPLYEPVPGGLDSLWKPFGEIGDPGKAPIKIKQIVTIGPPWSMFLVAVAYDAVADDGSLWYRSMSEASVWDQIDSINECDLRLEVASDDNSEDGIITKFKNEFERKKTECAVLIVRAKSDSNKWTIAGFNDEEKFCTVVLDDQTDELWQELKKGITADNESGIIKLATLKLGRDENSYWKCIMPIQTIDNNRQKQTIENIFFAINNKAELFRFKFNKEANIGWSRRKSLQIILEDNFKIDFDFTSIAILSSDDTGNNTLLIAGKSLWIENKAENNTKIHKLWDISYSSVNNIYNHDFSKPKGPTLIGLIGGKDHIISSEFCWVIDDHPTELTHPAFKTLYLLLTINKSEGVGSNKVLAWWTPLDADPQLVYDDTPPARSLGTLNQTPAIVNTFVLVPGDTRDVLVGNFVPLQRQIFSFSENDLNNRMKTRVKFEEDDILYFGKIFISMNSSVIVLSLKDKSYLYLFPKLELSGDRGMRYPFTTLYSASKGGSNTELILKSPFNDKINDQCVLVLEYTSSTTNELSYSVHTVMTFTPPSGGAEDATATVIDKESLPSDLPTTGEFKYYVYVKPSLPFDGGNFSASWDGVSKDEFKLKSPFNDKINDQCVLVLEYTSSTNNELSYSVHTVKTFTPPSGGAGDTTVTVNENLPENLPLNAPFIYYLYTLNLNDKKAYAIPFVYSIKPTISYATAPEEVKKLLKPDCVLHFLDTRTIHKQKKVEEAINTVVVLRTAWTKPPTPSNGQHYLAIDATQADWSRYTADVATKPDLSWEYWKGGGWWTIKDVKEDGTQDLKQSGTLKFTVPSDIQPTEVLGRKNWWIRARLLGGHFGQEVFEVTKKPGVSGAETQSVVVNTDNIRAPLVLSIKIAYSICTPITPKYLLTFDSGSWRDQSDANRTGGATVEAFVPIAERLQQMSGIAASTAGSPATAIAPCGCGNAAVSATVAGAPAEPPASKSSEASDSRAIYLAFANKLEGDPIKLLFLLEDQDHDEAMPLRVEVLRDNRFEPVNAPDETRALGESGVITLSLDASPTQTELFGFPGFWIRLRPYKPDSPDAPWRPRIRGAYANAVWAEAVETQEKEILGSSDGSPSQRFALIRSPVLENGLELRVREPLGDEEMKQLIRTDKTVVKDDVPGLPGRWVRWTEVPDPGDAGPDDRVYALDFANGEIRFGDGEHGAIPPIGRDAVVAFQYRHGGEAAANAVPPFKPLNLVTPIDGVEAAITPDHAAGGADPEADAAVLRCASAKLRHRDRAITLKDLEDLALDYSPFIAQARAFTTAQSTRLVVVIAGSNPDPSQALARELKRYLLDHASPALARKDALTIVKPEQVKFRLRISLTVASLDVTGRIVKETTEKVKAFFDPATGGYDGLGWRLGDSPTDADVAAQLIAIDNIEGIGDVRFSRADDVATAPERLPIKSDQLAWLAPDGIKIEFSTGMVTT